MPRTFTQQNKQRVRQYWRTRFMATQQGPAEDHPPQALAAFVSASTGFILEPWQQIICARLDRLRTERGARILIHGPPQFGKSILISQRFPAYALLHDPLLRIRLACYNVSHAERFSKVVLSLLRDPALASVPDARVPAICASEEWSTAARAALRDANPSFKALGLGTGFTGIGVDALIIDDPYRNAQDARSAAINVMLWDWWQQVVLSRLHAATNVVVMFHRWWEGDFAGRLMEQGGWEALRFPAIADGLPGDPTGRALGALLSPRFSAAHLADVRRRMGTAFEALYQGVPYPAAGGMFKAGKAQFADAAPVVASRVRRWDIAATSGAGDYTVGVLMCRVPPGQYIIEDVVRGQWESAKRDAVIRETAERDAGRGPVLHVLPQDPGAAGKAQAAAFVRLLAGFAVMTETESGDKTTRADPFSSQWNAGNVAIVRGAWNEAYLSELLAFPHGKHDDQSDASSGAFNRLAAMLLQRTAVGGNRASLDGGVR